MSLRTIPTGCNGIPGSAIPTSLTVDSFLCLLIDSSIIFYNWWELCLLFQTASQGWGRAVWKYMSERPAGGSRAARRRCWRLCGGANYAALLDATLTFNAAAWTGRQMQPNNTASLPLSRRSCLSAAFNSKNNFKERSGSSPSACTEEKQSYGRNSLTAGTVV